MFEFLGIIGTIFNIVIAIVGVVVIPLVLLDVLLNIWDMIFHSKEKRAEIDSFNWRYRTRWR